MYIGNFLSIKSPYEIHQNQCLSWLSTAHHLAQKSQHHTQEEYLKMLLRVGCSEQQIERRFFFVPDVTHLDFDNNEIYPVKTSTRGVSMHHRHEFYHKTVRELFHRIYEERSFPDDLIHVSCTGYISPSASADIHSLNIIFCHRLLKKAKMPITGPYSQIIKISYAQKIFQTF